MVIPGFTIHQVVYFVHVLLDRTVHLADTELMPVAVAAAVASGAEVSHQSISEVRRPPVIPQLPRCLDRFIQGAPATSAVPQQQYPDEHACLSWWVAH